MCYGNRLCRRRSGFATVPGITVCSTMCVFVSATQMRCVRAGSAIAFWASVFRKEKARSRFPTAPRPLGNREVLVSRWKVCQFDIPLVDSEVACGHSITYI